MRLLLTVSFLVPLQSGRFPQSLQRTQRFGGVFQCLTLDVDERKQSPFVDSARTCKSPTLEDSGTVSGFLFPLGKATFT